MRTERLANIAATANRNHINIFVYVNDDDRDRGCVHLFVMVMVMVVVTTLSTLPSAPSLVSGAAFSLLLLSRFTKLF